MARFDLRSTLEKVVACREKHSMGIDGARRVVIRDELRDQIRKIEDMEDVRLVLLALAPALEHSDDY